MLTEIILIVVCSWVPILIGGAIGYGILKDRVANVIKRLDKMEASELLTTPAHKVMSDACQLQIQTQINHIQSEIADLKKCVKEDVKEIKDMIVNGENKRDATRDELKEVLIQLHKELIKRNNQ